MDIEKKMMHLKFGNFNDKCKSKSLPSCDLVYTKNKIGTTGAE